MEFKKWVQALYPIINEEQWADIVAADESHNYELYPTERAPPPQQSPVDGGDTPSDPVSNAEDIPAYNPAAYQFEASSS